MAKKLSYYLSDILSENIGETPEQFLVCRGACIARTGFQKYKARELPQEQLAGLGLKFNPDDEVELYRPREEVFHPDCIASFESKPVTDNHPPGDTFVDADNAHEYEKGHGREIREGKSQLDSGDWPLLADIIVTHGDLANDIRSGKRQISCGYTYDLDYKDGKILQVNLRGNHIAIVPKGRAGAEARIKDAAPEDKAPVAKTTNKKEHHVSNRLMDLLGLGLRAKAADAATTPEELAEAAGEVSKLKEKPVEPRKSEDRSKDDAHAEVPAKEPEKKPAPTEK